MSIPLHTKTFIEHLTNYSKARWIKNMEELNSFFDIWEQIGSGAYGIVYRAIDKSKQQTKALKFCSKTHSKSAKNLQEVIILSRLQHPNIITLDGVYETDKRVCLVLEYCPISLSKLFEERKSLAEEEVKQIIKYLASAIDYMHKIGIVHRDLKIENILIGTNPKDSNDKWFIKLIDFGISAFRKPSSSIIGSNVFDELCGTVQYMAPELVTHSYSRLCDVWSLGVIMYCLLTGKFPYLVSKKANLEDLKNIISKQEIDYDIPFSEKCILLIRQCLSINPTLRLTAGEITIDSWITGKEGASSTNILELMNNYSDLSRSKSETETSRTSIVRIREESKLATESIMSYESAIKVSKEPNLILKKDDNEPKVSVITSESALKLISTRHKTTKKKSHHEKE